MAGCRRLWFLICLGAFYAHPGAGAAADATAPASPMAGSARMAVQAQVDLVAGEETGALVHGHITEGDGVLRRAHWFPVSEQDRTYSAIWTIGSFKWQRVTLRFMSTRQGTVTVFLRGPWEKETTDTLYRQDVYWDDVSASGTVLSNGSFEVHQAGIPDAWHRPWDDETAARRRPAIAADGRCYVTTWANGPLATRVTVTAWQPVTMTFHARAAVPTRHAPMVRLRSAATPAHRAASRFSRGINIGNCLEVPPGANWRVPHNAGDLRAIAREGFDHVRIPTAWQHYCGPPPTYTISDAFFRAVDDLVTNAVQYGLNAIVNVHHFDRLATDPPAHSNQLFQIWRQVARHYRAYPPELAFEILNEPRGGATTEWMNGFYAAVLPEIRASNPNRTVFVQPGQWGAVHALGRLSLPARDDNLIVSVHSYVPFLFTHQGASWAGPSASTTNITYPGPPQTPATPAFPTTNHPSSADWLVQYNTLPSGINPCSRSAFVAGLEYARDWSRYYGRPVHVGEFGCYHYAPAASRLRFYREKRECLDQLGLGWAAWDWKAGFPYWDPDAGQPVPGMRDSLFPRVEPISGRPVVRAMGRP